jgi:hypothetical protein
MSGPGELTWNEAMERAHAALIDSERLYDDINASKGRSNLDIEKHLRRSEVRAAQAQAWLMLAGELGSQGERTATKEPDLGADGRRPRRRRTTTTRDGSRRPGLKREVSAADQPRVERTPRLLAPAQAPRDWLAHTWDQNAASGSTILAKRTSLDPPAEVRAAPCRT